MDISFKSVAFQLQYTSAQIDAVYALLGLVDNGNYRIPSATLKMYKGDLPEKFKEWLEQCDENINICFEHHKMPDTNLSSFNDWDLIEYDWNMNITLIGNVNELTAIEQKALYTDGADIYTGVYYLVADAEYFTQNGRDVNPNIPALRSLSGATNITWIITTFRGKRVAFGSVPA